MITNVRGDIVNWDSHVRDTALPGFYLFLVPVTHHFHVRRSTSPFSSCALQLVRMCILEQMSF
jgi:hypothetical protein